MDCGEFDRKMTHRVVQEGTPMQCPLKEDCRDFITEIGHFMWIII